MPCCVIVDWWPDMRRVLCLLLLCFPSILLAESYITDSIMVGVFSGPELQGQPVTRLKSGVPVEVLEQQGDVRRIKTEHGDTGWLRATFLTSSAPKIKQLAQAKKEIAELEAELEAAQSKTSGLASKEAEAAKSIKWMRAEMNKARKKVKALEARLKEKQSEESQADEQTADVLGEIDRLKRENASLESRLAATLMINDLPDVSAEEGGSSLLWLFGGLLLGLLLGVGICYAWWDRRLRKRFGGIRFY